MASKIIETVLNPSVIKLADIPVLDYPGFLKAIDQLMTNDRVHCLSYFAYPTEDHYRFICLMADDSTGKTCILSHQQPKAEDILLESITARHFAFHIFEREIHEDHGISFTGHPWLKPVRFPTGRAKKEQTMNNYPFYAIESEDLHEVGVGPIHAGVIEPGYFRFICNGEKVLHLEIHLGYQHRGIEQLMLRKDSVLKRVVLSENISGDTAIGHSWCHVQLTEALGEIFNISPSVQNISPSTQYISPSVQNISPSTQYISPSNIERTIALELERIAMHVGDTAALCTDIAFQFGQVVNEALRTIVINTTQLWCGNRFGKGLIRPGGSHYPLTSELVAAILANLKDVEERYLQMADELFAMPSVLNRFESTGRVSAHQARLIGTVGMAARSSGLNRDIRSSHPFGAYKDLRYETVVLDQGDVWARAMLRKTEVEKSIRMIRYLLSDKFEPGPAVKPRYEFPLASSSLAVSMVEGWRGEIVHAAITDESGRIIYYKIKDPSMHNWMALALAVRNQEISDFPLCNKSYNLSYCGNDL